MTATQFEQINYIQTIHNNTDSSASTAQSIVQEFKPRNSIRTGQRRLRTETVAFQSAHTLPDDLVIALVKYGRTTQMGFRPYFMQPKWET